MTLDGIVAAVAGVGDDALKADADLVLKFRKHPGERMSIIRQVGQRFDVGDKLAAFAAVDRVGDQPGDAVDNAEPPVGERQQRHPAIGGDAPTIEGRIEGRADFLAPRAWQIEQKAGIVIYGGRGASLLWNSVGVSNQSLFQISRLRYVRQPVFRRAVGHGLNSGFDKLPG